MTPWPRHHPRANEFIVIAVLTALILVVGWRAMLLLKTPAGGPSGAIADGARGPAAAVGGDQLVYSTYGVVDRGAKDWANDDRLEYSYYRYPLVGGRPELITQVTEDNAKSFGSPWMRPLSPDTLLFMRRHSGSDDYVWIDVSGRELPRPTPPSGSGIDGLPSPDGSRVAYVDPQKKTVTVVTSGSLLQTFDLKSGSDVGFWSPLVWSPDSRLLYLKPVFEGGGFVSGLWVIDLDQAAASEIKVFRRLGLNDVTVDAKLGLAVGATMSGGSESDYSGPSKLYLVDLRTGEARALLSDPSLAYRDPLLSPDGLTAAFSFAGPEPDVWLADVVSSAMRLLISGRALAWTPDGRALVVSRDNELQIVDISPVKVTSIARRIGKYNDPDFQGLEFIGLVKGKNQ